MKFTGGCYCGEVRYHAEGEPIIEAQCHCRECQYIAGGSPNVLIAMPAEGFRYTQGKPKQFSRSDLDNPVTREFCANCGTHLTSKPPGFPGVIVKVGTMDNPADFGGPDMAIFTADKQTFHQIADDMPAFEGFPG